MEKISRSIKIGILGGAGLAAGELLKLLCSHPEVQVVYVESSSSADKPLVSIHRNLKNSPYKNLEFSRFNPSVIGRKCDLVFSCKPSGKSREMIKRLVDSKLKIIDLSADYRLTNKDQYKMWYNSSADYSGGQGAFVYGLPEINRQEIKESSLISNPGCYVTGVILGLAPLMKSQVVENSGIIINSYSGISGAGRTHKPGKNLFIDLDSNLIPYSHGTHGHTPEIEQELEILTGSQVTVLFMPHIVPLSRGILSTMVLKPKTEFSNQDLVGLYNDFYRKEPLVNVSSDPPEISMVANTNRCEIGLNLDERTNLIIITSVIDNLLKGASGQAVQNMNLMCGFPELTALPY